MATSTAHAFHCAFVDAVAAALPAGNVFFGWPDDDAGDEVVYTGDIELDQEWAAMARTTKPRKEIYSLEFFVEASAPAGSAREASAAAWAHLAVVEDVLRNSTNPEDGVTLGVDGVWQCELRTGSAQLGFIRNKEKQIIGRVCRIEATVRVQARIKL